MRMYVGVTDGDWFRSLSGRVGLDEVNFWQPSGSTQFKALTPGELFLFKLHSPENFIVGGGVFAYFSLLPVSLAWAAFGEKNGVSSLVGMRRRIAKYRRKAGEDAADYTVGCVLLEQPFFLERHAWIPIPDDWSSNIVRGKGYETSSEAGLALWRQLGVRASWSQSGDLSVSEPMIPRYGDPVPVCPRLGQGTFRVVVTDAYHRRCAVTGERTLPVLQAAHIRPFGLGGENSVRNGLLLRSDLHLLFDGGYLTVTPELRVEVSRRIREEFENGRDYYALHGKVIEPPARHIDAPSPELLSWHNEQVFRT